MATSDNVKKHRDKRRTQLLTICGNKCNLCGYDKCLSALEFHHIDPSTKKYTLAKGNCHSIIDDVEEAKKCILVCANCHREIHEGLVLKNLYNFRIFNEILANQYIIETNGVKPTHCKECGAPITVYSTSGLCSVCAHKQNRIVDRPSREVLKDLIRTESFESIGRIYGVTGKAISKWCVSEGLPSKKQEINKISDEDWSKI